MARSPRKKPLAPPSAGHPSQPTPNEQSGSAGRATPPDAANHRGDSGQGRYGQTGDGNVPGETDGQARYRRSDQNGAPESKVDSNKGSGQVDADDTTKDIPKTG
jgi:hypothetical protein